MVPSPFLKPSLIFITKQAQFSSAWAYPSVNLPLSPEITASIDVIYTIVFAFLLSINFALLAVNTALLGPLLFPIHIQLKPAGKSSY